MRANHIEREQAIALRQKGLSYREIRLRCAGFQIVAFPLVEGSRPRKTTNPTPI